jgi:hypothetical protein
LLAPCESLIIIMPLLLTDAVVDALLDCTGPVNIMPSVVRSTACPVPAGEQRQQQPHHTPLLGTSTGQERLADHCRSAMQCTGDLR